MALKIHAICLALNESPFIEELLKSLYPFCKGISILSQYDRDWYGQRIAPDCTCLKVLDFPDPEGKIHLSVRRWNDEAAARNQEMLALDVHCAKSVISHGSSKEDILNFHAKPDYFLIVDADEIYDLDTLGNVISYLEKQKPQGMRVFGYNYVRTWNRRVPMSVVEFRQFGFIKPGILFKMRRTVSWNESRLSKLFLTLRLPDYSAKIYGFIDCPPEIGVFHHGCWLGDDERLRKKTIVSSHKKKWEASYPEQIESIKTIFVPKAELPRNIRDGNWPASFFEDEKSDVQ